MFVLCYVLLLFGLGMVEGMMGLSGPGLGPLTGFYQLALLLPWLALTARRLHDSGHSGWWQLLSLVPLLGWFAVLWFLLADTGQEPNQHGPPTSAGAELVTGPEMA